MASTVIFEPKKGHDRKVFGMLLTDIDNLLYARGFVRVANDPPTYISVAKIPAIQILEILKSIKSMQNFKHAMNKINYSINMPNM